MRRHCLDRVSREQGWHVPEIQETSNLQSPRACSL